VPSKFYGIAAAGRAIACVTASDGDLARRIAEHRCGIVVEPGNGPRLAAELRRLAAAPEALSEMGRRARAMLDASYTRRQAYAMWEDLLESIP
jgi:glycosyltransferase involved in cell wall biosynthesis